MQGYARRPSQAHSSISSARSRGPLLLQGGSRCAYLEPEGGLIRQDFTSIRVNNIIHGPMGNETSMYILADGYISTPGWDGERQETTTVILGAPVEMRVISREASQFSKAYFVQYCPTTQPFWGVLGVWGSDVASCIAFGCRIGCNHAGRRVINAVKTCYSTWVNSHYGSTGPSPSRRSLSVAFVSWLDLVHFTRNLLEL